MSDFNRAFELVIGHEGGFQNDRADRGNWTSGRQGVGELKGTKYGITAMSYPELDIPNITLDDARAIYERDYWRAAGCDELEWPLSFNVFDAAVNSGVDNAKAWLRESGGNAARFNAVRLQFMTNLATWDRFGRGWARRIVKNLKV